MLSYCRSVGALLACFVCGALAFLPAVSLSDGNASTGAGEPGGAPLLLARSPLAVPGVQQLDGSQQLGDQALAERLDPEAVAARERSRTAYEGLSSKDALRVAREELPGVTSAEPTGLGQLPAGAHVARYLSGDAAQISLPGGKHAVAVSTGPVATRGSSGGYTPVDLSLQEASSSYRPANSDAPVSIPKSLADGVRLDGSDVSITPVDGAGGALRGAGQVDGGAVVYANTETDADTVVKPTSDGFETYSVLRSVESPQQLAFKIGVPKGASVQPAQNEPGAARVVAYGQTIATIPAPVAVDAAGTPVPLSTTLSGDTLRVSVEHRSGEYQYPIAVDPTVVDSELYEKTYPPVDWQCSHEGSKAYCGDNWGAYLDIWEGHVANEWASLVYPTQGESHIYEISGESQSWANSSWFALKMGIFNESGWEATQTLPTSYSRTAYTACVNIGCPSSSGTAHNLASFWLTATAGSGKAEFQADTASVYIAQTNGPTISANTTSESIGTRTNVLYGSPSWLSPKTGAAEFNLKDPGVGVHEVEYHVVGGEKWTKTVSCAGPVQCPETANQTLYYETHIPDGEPKLEVKALNAMGGSATTTVNLKVDGNAPHEITLSGLPENGEIGDGARNLTLTAHATDGTTGVTSSGVASLKLTIDGVEIGSANGACSPGPCTASGSWSINAEDFAAGQHTATVTAVDVVGNTATSNTTFTVHHAAPISMGPGSLNPVTGEFELEESDVSIPALGSPLTVTRTYGSRDPSAGTYGALGAPWAMSFGGARRLESRGGGWTMVLVSTTGAETEFYGEGGGKFKSLPGDNSLVLTSNAENTEYTLTENGASTKFTHISGDAEGIYRPGFVTSSGGFHTVQYTYQVVSGVLQPLQELAPVPPGVTCAPTLKAGCRALTYNFATSTTATGEAPGQWGDYAGRLTRVYFATSEGSTAVAQYSYDSKGRLRAEWDPRVSPALKDEYGYDSEGHVTAISSPGTETVAFTYGTISGDTSAGRLLKVMQPRASEALWGGEAPKNTAAPNLTGSAAAGTRMTASDGSWSGGPIAYGYQWEQCNSSGGECKAIGGATNANYTPSVSDVGHRLVAQVTATNGGGSVVASSSASAVVTQGAPMLESSTGTHVLNATTCVPATATCVTSAGAHSFYSTEVNTIASTSWTSWERSITGPSDALSCPSSSLCLLAAGESGGHGGTLYYATSLGGSWTQAFAPSYGVDAISCASASFCVAGQDNGGDFRYSTSPASTSWTQEQQGSGAVTGVSCLSSSFCAMVDSVGKVRVATSTGQIESSSWKETSVDGTTALDGIACTSTTSCVAVDTVGKVLKLTIGSGGEASVAAQEIDGTSLTAVSCSSSTCVAVDNEGLYFLSYDSGKTWTANIAGRAYAEGVELSSVSCASPALCVAADVSGRTYAIDPEIVPGATRSPQPGATIEYGVPVSGSKAPYSMGSSDVAKWAQTDVPVEATAVFPPEHTSGWPASSYYGAEIDYFDAVDHLVNVANASGGIVTSEYNSYNDVVRNLTPDNRSAALKEGSKSAEASQKLDTQNKYAAEGTELTSVLGPLHTVKLSSGATVQARSYTVYNYETETLSGEEYREAPPGGPYRLVTEVTQGAQIAGEPEADVRTTRMSYAGQNNLGWVLRKPTATRTDPGGLELIHSTVYDPTTGNVVETRSPGAGAPGEEVLSGYIYKTTFGSSGNGNGQFSSPAAIATDAEGNLWVADTANNRVEELSSGGTYMRQFGAAGNGNGQLKSPKGITIDGEGNVWVADTGNNRVQEFSSTGTYIRQYKPSYGFTSPTAIVYAGASSKFGSQPRLYILAAGQYSVRKLDTEGQEIGQFGEWGSGNGEFKSPEGVAVDGEGNVWVADTGDNRVEEFEEGGGYLAQFGTVGSGNGQLSKPQGVAINGTGEILVADSGNNRVESFSSSGAYQFQFGTVGSGEKQLKAPAGLALDSAGDAYVIDTGNNRIEKWVPAASVHESSGTGGTHGQQTIYYTAGENEQVYQCGWKPEWAGLPCETRPAAQPETSGVPNLPVTRVTYNTWDEPLSSTETVGSTTRTTKNTYDAAGRLVSEQVTSTVGAALPTVNFEYNSETGALSKQSTTVESVTRSIEYVRNRLGEVTSYTDADGNTSTFSYDTYGRLASANDGKGSQTYSYLEGSGLLGAVIDSAAGQFDSGYDVEGNVVDSTYPNWMRAEYSYDATGADISVEYKKLTHCTSACTWYSESEVPSIHGQTLSQTSTLSSQSYTYDAAGRLTKTQDTPAGEGCTTRIYAYDEETNIDSLTTRAPGGESKCASEGGTSVNHSYDSANRLIDGGISYDTFGDITKLPAGDAGGSEVASSYYVDETLASQSQNGETIGYYLDPTGRDRQIVSTGTTNSTVTYHYAGDGRAPTWTEDTSGKWTRNIYGVDGTLVATQAGGESPVLQIEDMKGNIVGTASLSETATGLLSKGDSTEYGVPRTSSPPKYSWQGAEALRTELPSGIVAMGARSYVPEIGRFLQPDPIEGGSANAYAYTYGDPVGSSDPSGEFTVGTPSWVSGFFDEEAEVATEAAIQRAAEEQAAREEAEEKAREAAEEAAEAAEAAAEIASGGGGKAKRKGKAKAKGGGGGAVATASHLCRTVKECEAIEKRKNKSKPKSKPNYPKKCLAGEVRVGKHCEKGPGKKQRPDPPPPPPSPDAPPIIGPVEEGINDCIEIGVCA